MGLFFSGKIISVPRYAQTLSVLLYDLKLLPKGTPNTCNVDSDLYLSYNNSTRVTPSCSDKQQKVTKPTHACF